MIYSFHASKLLKTGRLHNVNNNVDADNDAEAKAMATRQLRRLYGSGYKISDVTPVD